MPKMRHGLSKWSPGVYQNDAKATMGSQNTSKEVKHRFCTDLGRQFGSTFYQHFEKMTSKNVPKINARKITENYEKKHAKVRRNETQRSYKSVKNDVKIVTFVFLVFCEEYNVFL